MKGFRDKGNLPLFIIFYIFSVFLIFALVYRDFTNKIASVSSGDANYGEILYAQSSRFIYELLVIFVIALLVIFLFNHMVFYRQTILENRIKQISARYSTVLDMFADSLWEYDIVTNTLKKSVSDSGLFTSSTEIHNFRDYILDSGLLNPDDNETVLHFFDSMLSHDTAPLNVQFRARSNEDEAEAWYECTGYKIFDSYGIPISVVGRTVNISRIKEREVLLHEIEGQDKLTKLHNLETTHNMVDHYLSSIDYAVISAMFLIDLDNFTEINNSLGNSFGDAILLDLSARLKKRFQAQDIIGRVGGDSFVVFLADAPSISYIEECAEDICILMRDIYSGSNNTLSVTGSVGVAVFPSDGNNYDILCEKASRALWEAKQLGKDRYFLFSNEGASEDDASHVSDYFSHDIAAYAPASFEDHSLVNTSIVMNAIDILFNTQDNNDSLQMLLSLIGTYYNLDRVSIVEYSGNPQTFSITSEWTSHPRYQIKDSIQQVPMSLEHYYARYRETENGIFYSDSYLLEYQEGMVADIMPDRVPRAYFQCGFLDHGSYIGSISATISDGAHSWSQSEIDSLTLISKIIGSYLSRLRSIRYANWISKTDQLTGAHNFDSFLSEVNKLHTNRPDMPLAMIYSDIRQFKLINDNYGYQTGDDILKSLTDIFRTLFPSGLCCRISGDKFVICIKYSGEEALASKARMLISRCRQLASPEGEPYRLSLILGIYPMAESDTAITAVDRANIARKSAQRHESAGYAFFTSTMRSSLILQKDLEDAMENSILENDFLLYFQPKVNIITGKLCGAEALVRWQHPTLGFLYPNAFIPLFEANGFIIDLDYYMFEQSCIFIRDELKKGKELFPISVNFSREHFKTDGLPEKLKAAVEFYSIPPELLEIEITESAFTTVDKHFIVLLNRIRSYGFRLAMDDFGAGLSSLNLLCDLPFNVIKIDKDFLHSKTTTSRERIVISNIVRMTSELDMEVICEGVETVEQTEFLKSIGCTMAQGYLYSKPLSKQEFVEKYML